jgi:hypothetical protein
MDATISKEVIVARFDTAEIRMEGHLVTLEVKIAGKLFLLD